ncbi:MAG: hypothetical protein DRN71_00560 [Candidatus Nanohalarchaeota archaeon]|nr:MAG: hypothetical protein DRN71_00560 [Candidatus Nanohaloarchaeota archaeon]
MSTPNFSRRTVFDGIVPGTGKRTYTPLKDRLDANSKTVRAKFPHLRYNNAINKYFNGEAPPIVEELKEQSMFLAIRYTDICSRKQTMCSTFGDSEYPIGIDPETEQLYMERPDKEAIIIDGDPNTLKFIDLHTNNLHCNDLFANPEKYEELWTDLIK